MSEYEQWDVEGRLILGKRTPRRSPRIAEVGKRRAILTNAFQNGDNDGRFSPGSMFYASDADCSSAGPRSRTLNGNWGSAVMTQAQNDLLAPLAIEDSEIEKGAVLSGLDKRLNRLQQLDNAASSRPRTKSESTVVSEGSTVSDRSESAKVKVEATLKRKRGRPRGSTKAAANKRRAQRGLVPTVWDMVRESSDQAQAVLQLVCALGVQPSVLPNGVHGAVETLRVAAESLSRMGSQAQQNAAQQWANASPTMTGRWLSSGPGGAVPNNSIVVFPSGSVASQPVQGGVAPSGTADKTTNPAPQKLKHGDQQPIMMMPGQHMYWHAAGVPAGAAPHGMPGSAAWMTSFNMMKHGSSCHQCKTRRPLSELFSCTRKISRRSTTRRCRKKYCDRCLNRFYEQLLPDSVKLGESGERKQAASTVSADDARKCWECPSCLGLCVCAACRRNANAQKVDSVRKTSDLQDKSNIKKEVRSGST